MPLIYLILITSLLISYGIGPSKLRILFRLLSLHFLNFSISSLSLTFIVSGLSTLSLAHLSSPSALCCPRSNTPLSDVCFISSCALPLSTNGPEEKRGGNRSGLIGVVSCKD